MTCNVEERCLIVSTRPRHLWIRGLCQGVKNALRGYVEGSFFCVSVRVILLSVPLK